MPAKLIVESEIDKSRQDVLFDKARITIGRKAGNDLHFARPEISGTHAAFLKENDQYFVSDLGSTNGTLLNGAPLLPNEKYPLNDLDVVTVSPFRITFSEPRDASATMLEQNALDLDKFRKAAAAGTGTIYEPVSKMATGTAEQNVESLIQAVEAAGGTDPDLQATTRNPPPPGPVPAAKPPAPKPSAPAQAAPPAELPPIDTKEPSSLPDFIWIAVGGIFILLAIGLVVLIFLF